MTLEIKQADALSDDEVARLFRWGEDIYSTATFALEWRHKDLHFLLLLEGQPVSHVGVLKHTIEVAGRTVVVGGLGGVVTIPSFQRRGYARKLMSHTAEFFSNWGVEAGLLFCLPRRVTYYASQGWQLIQTTVFIQQANDEIVSPLKVMVLPFGNWPEGDIHLNSLPW